MQRTPGPAPALTQNKLYSGISSWNSQIYKVLQVWSSVYYEQQK